MTDFDGYITDFDKEEDCQTRKFEVLPLKGILKKVWSFSKGHLENAIKKEEDSNYTKFADESMNKFKVLVKMVIFRKKRNSRFNKKKEKFHKTKKNFKNEKKFKRK